MVEVPENKVTEADIAKWYEISKRLSQLKSEEGLLRKRVFDAFFPDPKEGTNTHVLTDGYQLKGVHSINRSVDPATVRTLRDVFIEKGLKPDELVQWKPELVKSEYNTLTEEEKQLFDQCLIIKDGSPSMEIKPPSKKKGGTPPPGVA